MISFSDQLSSAIFPPKLKGLFVVVDRVIHIDNEKIAGETPYAFAYFITIHNQSIVPVTIRGRKWVIRDASKHTLVVEGDGIVGEYPRIETGHCFSYNSYHTSRFPECYAEGAYWGTTEEGRLIVVKIPGFWMNIEKETVLNG